MKVKELIEELQKLDQDLEVWIEVSGGEWDYDTDAYEVSVTRRRKKKVAMIK